MSCATGQAKRRADGHRIQWRQPQHTTIYLEPSSRGAARPGHYLIRGHGRPYEEEEVLNPVEFHRDYMLD